MYRRWGKGGGVGKEEKGKHETSPSVRQPISQATKNVSVLEKKKPLPLLVDETQARLEIGLVSLSWRCHVETISSFSLELFRVPSRWHLIFAFKFISDSFALFSLRPHHTHTHSRRRTIHKWPAMSGRGRRPLFSSLLVSCIVFLLISSFPSFSSSLSLHFHCLYTADGKPALDTWLGRPIIEAVAGSLKGHLHRRPSLAEQLFSCDAQHVGSPGLVS